MPHSLTGFLASTIAKAYGCLALVASVAYGLTRRETWHQPSAKEIQDFQKACHDLWSLDTAYDGLSHNFLKLENGLQLHYIAAHLASKQCDTLVIFLHGFPDTSHLWEHQLRSSYSASAQLVALDLPGCGGSDSLSRYGPDEMLNAVAEIIVKLKHRYIGVESDAAKRSILVSHDWGGVIAYRLAGETSGLIDEMIVMNSTYCLAAQERTASLLLSGRDSWRAGRFKIALSHLQPLFSQLLKSNYIFMLNLRLPLAKWFPWLAAALVRVCNENALRNPSIVSSPSLTKSLAASYGPSLSECASRAPDGSSYGRTVCLRAKKQPPGDWDERVRIYSEGLALGDWKPTYSGHHEPLWKSNPEMRKGHLSCPLHALFGLGDIALDKRIALDGVEVFMPKGADGDRQLGVKFDREVHHTSIGQGSVTTLPLCGHWSMLDREGERALDALLERLLDAR